MAEQTGPPERGTEPVGEADRGAVDVTDGSSRPLPADDGWAAAWPAPDTVRPPRRWRRSAPADVEPMGDWAWVEEWRRGGEPTPWGPGLFLATFAGLIIGCAVYVISTGLADTLWLAVAANIVVAAGLSPALWMSRTLPVLRWVGLGGAVGTVVAWISLLFFPHV